ncbi:MAG TPA: hypothetical protein VGC95_11590, partial [Chitinophagaceae bacterium]
MRANLLSSFHAHRLIPNHLAVLFTLFFIGACDLSAAVRFWTGNVDGNFSTPFNWVSNLAPANGDDIIFQVNSPAAHFIITNDFSPNRNFNSITFQGSNYVVRGNPIVVSNG